MNRPNFIKRIAYIALFCVLGIYFYDTILNDAEKVRNSTSVTVKPLSFHKTPTGAYKNVRFCFEYEGEEHETFIAYSYYEQIRNMEEVVMTRINSTSTFTLNFTPDKDHVPIFSDYLWLLIPLAGIIYNLDKLFGFGWFDIITRHFK